MMGKKRSWLPFSFSLMVATLAVFLSQTYPTSRTVANTKVLAEAEQTCSQTGGWTKIDSNDLSSYPVSSATQYCFKAGSSKSQGCEGGIFDSIPSGGFGSNDICGLSHWAYYIPSPYPSSSDCDCDTSPSPSPSLSPSPSPSTTPTPSPSITPSPSPELTPSPSPDPSEEPEPSPSPSPSISPSPSPSAPASSTPAPSDNNSDNNSESNDSGSSDTGSTLGESTSEGEVLGAYADTGIVEDSLLLALNPLGGLMVGYGTILYGKNKKKSKKD